MTSFELFNKINYTKTTKLKKNWQNLHRNKKKYLCTFSAITFSVMAAGVVKADDADDASRNRFA
jgi:hypothetical protein